MQTKIKQYKSFNVATRQRGVTLIELMVAMAVSSVIMLGISNIYLSTKKSYVVHDEFARLQENMRYSSDTLAREIRNAGYFGCAAGHDPASINNGLVGSEEIEFNFETGVFGFDAVGTDIGDAPVIDSTIQSNSAADWVTALGLTVKTIDNLGIQTSLALNAVVPAAITALAVPGSDILVLRGATGLGVKVAQQNTGAQVFLDDTTGLEVGACPHNVGVPGASVDGISGICDEDILMISDCTKARIFKTKNIAPVGGGPGACGGTLPCFNLVHSSGTNNGDNKAPSVWKDVFDRDAEAMVIMTRTFFIGIAAPGAEPTLYVRNNDSATPLPLVEGIENMQILYGVDTDATPDGIANRYFSAQNVPNSDGNTDTIFDGVVSIKLSLLVRTPQDMPGINRTAADYANLTYAMISPATPITIDPIPVDAASTDRRMRKVYNLTIKLRNK